MQQHKEGALDSGVYTVYAKEKVITNPLYNEKNKVDKKFWLVLTSSVHYVTLIILGLSTWVLLWCAWGDEWKWNGQWFRLAIVAIVAWGTGQILESLTTLPPLLAALLTGILARNLNILDMRQYTTIDAFLRKIYPVVILGKASLGWDVGYMKSNWCQVTTLGVLPWSAEVMVVAICTRYLFEFPWIWGILLGSIYASVSCAVVMPSVLKHGSDVKRTQNWPQLVCTAGGVDTALSVGVYGLIYSVIFCDTGEVYRYVKAGLTLFVGVALGVSWGSLAKLMPHSQDYYVTELRVLFVLVGGLLANFLTSHIGWGGTGGVAVLACNATAATFWAQDGWKLNSNPASTAYRVIWSALEPTLFAYTGTFFVLDSSMSETMLLGFGLLAVCLAVRLGVTCIVCWKMSVKEKIFICCTWMPKSIVEAVLCPLALDALIMRTERNHETQKEMEYSEQLMRIIIQAILVTTPIGYILTNYLGGKLLKKSDTDCETDIIPKRKMSSKNQHQSEA